MTPAPDETGELRSEIDQTRRRMDETIGALGERLQGRHLVDEVLGFLRHNPDQSREIGQKLSETASTAMHSVTHAIKANPVPALLIGAGVGWMIYQNRRSSQDSGYEARFDDEGYPIPESPALDEFYDRPLDYPAGAGRPVETSSETSSPMGGAGHRVAEKATRAADRVKQRFSDASERLRDRSHVMSEQARALGSRVQQRARDTYDRSRERVSATVHDHPLELGLACLAVGVIAGLALRTPARLDRAIGPSVDQLRDRTREAGSELLHKGQRVAKAAVDAAKQEASSQGLTAGSSASQPEPSAPGPIM